MYNDRVISQQVRNMTEKFINQNSYIYILITLNNS